MGQHTTAVFEHGALTPVEPLEGIPEHSIVHIVVEAVTSPSVEDQLSMLREVPVSEELADAIEAGRGREWQPQEF